MESRLLNTPRSQMSVLVEMLRLSGSRRRPLGEFIGRAVRRPPRWGICGSQVELGLQAFQTGVAAVASF
jgi:hypothetical protein